MNVVFSSSNNKSIKTKNQNVSFEAGLTPQMIQEIQRANVSEISIKLAKKGIPTDFKGNKIIAWCCDKTVEIFEQIDKNFGANLTLPKGIYVEDFANLNVDSQTLRGFCNLLPTEELRKNSNERILDRIVFFNTFDTFRSQQLQKNQWRWDWRYINSNADIDYSGKHSSTDHFLEVFLHELSHASHESRLLKKLKAEKTDKIIKELNKEEQLQKYRKLYGSRVNQICNYAANTPLDAIACDMSRTIANSLDKDTLLPKTNPFLNTPYEKLSFWQRVPKYSNTDRPLNEILRNFWNGKFD